MSDVPTFEHDSITILSANAAGCALLGMEEGELIGRPLLDFITDPDLSGLFKLRMNVLRSRRLGDQPMPLIRYPIKRKDGTIFIGEFTTTRLRNHYSTSVRYVREANQYGC